MARFNEILVGRYSRFLQKLFSMKGAAPMPQLSSELQPSLQFFNGAENRYLEGWDKFGILVGAAAGGLGLRSGIRMRNPVGSNVVIVIEKLIVENDQAGGAGDNPTLYRNQATTDFTTVVTSALTRMDPRGRSAPTMITSTSTNTGAQLGTSFWRFGLSFGSVAESAQDVIFTHDQELPILPGDALDFYANATNQGLSNSIWWRERFLEESERA